MKHRPLLIALDCPGVPASGMKRSRLLFALACASAIALSGCGFHPRAELVVPPELGPVKVVTGDPYSPLGESLSRALTHAHAQAADATDAKARVATLHIVHEEWTQVPLSVNAHAQATEYIITYVVKFSFTAADGTDIEPVQEARIERDFEYDVTHALGSASEQDTIRQEMQRDMAATIMRRIGIALRHYAPKS
ncbi:MAG TPA: LPS assembly lipoprotein LptE [Xanthomonadaceae bacterium]|jgi:LPS-assembly lipoprotein